MDSEEKAEPIDPNEKTEPIENAEFTEPMLHTEFTDPMLRNESREPMLFVCRSKRAGASGALFSEDLEVVLDIIKSSIPCGSPIPNESRRTLRAIMHTREQVVLCRKGRIFLPARAKNHLLAALRYTKALRGELRTRHCAGQEPTPESFNILPQLGNVTSCRPSGQQPVPQRMRAQACSLPQPRWSGTDRRSMRRSAERNGSPSRGR